MYIKYREQQNMLALWRETLKQYLRLILQENMTRFYNNNKKYAKKKGEMEDGCIRQKAHQTC